MTVTIDFLDGQSEIEVVTEDMSGLLIRMLKKAEEIEQISDKGVVIGFVDNDYIQSLNKQFRNINEPTDVLSFPLEEPDSLGDIIVSIPKAIEQAETYGHSFIRELSFLVLHGYLHLLGYDHETEEEEKIMFSKQEEILRMFDLTR